VPGLQITTDDIDVLARDGRVVHIRDLPPGDVADVQALHERASNQAINPFIARTDGLCAVDVRIRVGGPPHHPDPLVRQLRGPGRSARPAVDGTSQAMPKRPTWYCHTAPVRDPVTAVEST
jgi:hypothetical protein